MAATVVVSAEISERTIASAILGRIVPPIASNSPASPSASAARGPRIKSGAFHGKLS